MKRFLERDHDVRFDIASSFGAPLSLTKRISSAEACLSSAPEKRLEEIAETRSAEFEVDAAAIARRIALEPAARLRTPTRRRLKSAAGLIPIRAELVVFLSFLRISENFVGFVELLEFFFRRRLVLVDVGMVFARELAERFANLVVARRFRNAKSLVIISELNCHGAGRKVVRATHLRKNAPMRYLGRMRDLGRMLAILGGVITLVGIALWSGFGAGWLGRLPGDIRIERGNTAFYFPIVTCIIVSIVLTLLMSFFRR